MEKSYFSSVLLFSASDEESYFKKLIKEEKSPTLLRTFLIKAQALSSSVLAWRCIFPYGFILDDQTLKQQGKRLWLFWHAQDGIQTSPWPAMKKMMGFQGAHSWNFPLTPVFKLRLSYMYSVNCCKIPPLLEETKWCFQKTWEAQERGKVYNVCLCG